MIADRLEVQRGDTDDSAKDAQRSAGSVVQERNGGRVEIDHDEVRRDGFFFDPSSFRLDLYRLISAFYTTREFARVSRVSDSHPILRLAEEFQENEITRLLISIAGTARVIQDREHHMKSMFDAPCGDLRADTRLRSSVPLTVREACNKVIHAARFNFDAKPLPKSERSLPYPTYTLNPTIHLYGHQRKVPWKARLDVEKFVSRCALLIHG